MGFAAHRPSYVIRRFARAADLSRQSGFLPGPVTASAARFPRCAHRRRPLPPVLGRNALRFARRQSCPTLSAPAKRRRSRSRAALSASENGRQSRSENFVGREIAGGLVPDTQEFLSTLL